MASNHAWPAVHIPFDFLDGGLASERAPSAGAMSRFGIMAPRTAAQGGVIPFTGRGVHQRAMALLLQISVGSVEVADERTIRHDLEGTLVKGAGARHGLLMLVHRAAFRGEQIVPTILFV